MNNKITTYAEAYSAAAAKQKAAICKLIGCTDMQYCQFQYDCGLAYLQWYLPTDEDARRQLERSKLYWNWFKNQWTAHDYAFLQCEKIERHGLRLLQCMYEALHNPQALATEIKPSRIVLNEIKQTPKYVSYSRI